MGKKKDKENKVDKQGWARGLMNFAGDEGGSKEAKELLERYKVKGSSSHYGTKPSARNLPEHFRDNDVVKRELNEAMMNDYDTRRTIEAAAMAGNKDAKKFAKKGIDGKKGMLGAWDLMKDLKKEYVGGGGMNGAENAASLTYAAVKADRDAQTATYDEKYAKTTDLNDLKDKLMSQATEEAAEPIEPSDRMAQVEDRLEKAAGGSSNTPPSLFDKDNALPAKADDQADAARNFVEDYKKDVAIGANIRSDIETGVSNAARHVRDTYGR